MSAASAFFDTNVVLYLVSADAAKADRAEDLLTIGGTVSVQVLNEFAAVASHKLRMPWPEIIDVLAQVRATCSVEPLTDQTHERGIQIAQRYGLSLYDAMIVAAALLADCTILYSEDMQHGQVIDKQLTIRNPFAES
jgi:predicted nucleic acid-binding protein